MSGQSFVDQLKQKFGDKITGANLENVDPWVEVSADGLIEGAAYRSGLSPVQYATQAQLGAEGDSAALEGRPDG